MKKILLIAWRILLGLLGLAVVGFFVWIWREDRLSKAAKKDLVSKSQQGQMFEAQNSPYPILISELQIASGWDYDLKGNLIVVLPKDALTDPPPVFIPYYNPGDSNADCAFEIRYTRVRNQLPESVPLKWEDCVFVNRTKIQVDKVTIQFQP